MKLLGAVVLGVMSLHSTLEARAGHFWLYNDSGKKADVEFWYPVVWGATGADVMTEYELMIQKGWMPEKRAYAPLPIYDRSHLPLFYENTVWVKVSTDNGATYGELQDIKGAIDSCGSEKDIVFHVNTEERRLDSYDECK